MGEDNVDNTELPHVPSKVEESDEILPVVDAPQEGKEVVVKEKRKMASLCKLFSMMDGLDVFVLTLGMIGAIGNGVSQPLMCIVFGDLIDGMGLSGATPPNFATMTPEQMQAYMDNAMSGMMDEMNRLCVIMCLVGVANIVAATLQGACFKIFAEKQTGGFRRLRWPASSASSTSTLCFTRT
mmetsp:Transcript_7146/g.12329  ORF Transcript_7146/g.12329 Transcript_7146/m.12329 type:complete len:182 (+) Transcript_7146:59-604(+)